MNIFYRKRSQLGGVDWSVNLGLSFSSSLLVLVCLYVFAVICVQEWLCCSALWGGWFFCYKECLCPKIVGLEAPSLLIFLSHYSLSCP